MPRPLERGFAPSQPLSIHVAPVPNLQNQDHHDVIVNFVQHAVVPNAEPKHTRFTGKRLHAMRPGIVFQEPQAFIEPLLNVLRERQKGALRRGLEPETIAWHLREPGFATDRLVGHVARLCPRGSHGFHVKPVFKRFEQLEVFDRHERSDRFTVSLEYNSVPLERDAVQRLRERISNVCGGNLCHLYILYRMYAIRVKRDVRFDALILLRTVGTMLRFGGQ